MTCLPGVRGRRSKGVAAGEAQKAGPLACWYLEHIGQALGDLFGWPTGLGFNLAQGNGRAAHPRSQLFLGEVKGAAALPEPFAERSLGVHRAPPGVVPEIQPKWSRFYH